MERVDYESIVIQELINAHQREELNIAPWYQRRAVWTRPQKAYLINTIFAGMPVPTLYIRHAIDMEREKTVKEVVDGQQRIRSILEYRDGEFRARHPDHTRRVAFKDLTSAQRERFLMTKLPVGYLVGASDGDVIEIFGRLNAVSKTLNAQEKRSARHSGEFHQFCLRQAAARLPIWKDLNIFTSTGISRMDEVQFVAELAMAMVDGMEDSSAARIDAAYKRWDDDFPDANPVEREFNRIFGLIAETEPAAIKETIFSRSPVFFSLVLVLAEHKKLPTQRKLAATLWNIDSRFNDSRPVTERPQEDLDFVAACTSSTQRIRSRRTRFDYIATFV